VKRMMCVPATIFVLFLPGLAVAEYGEGQHDHSGASAGSNQGANDTHEVTTEQVGRVVGHFVGLGAGAAGGAAAGGATGVPGASTAVAAVGAEFGAKIGEKVGAAVGDYAEHGEVPHEVARERAEHPTDFKYMVVSSKSTSRAAHPRSRSVSKSSSIRPHPRPIVHRGNHRR